MTSIQHMLLCEHDEKKKITTCKPVVQKSPFDIKYGKEIVIPNSNRLTIHTHDALSCKAIGNDVECKLPVQPATKRYLPRMCTKKDGDTVCGLDMERNDVSDMPFFIKNVNDIKPQFRPFLTDNDVTVLQDKDMLDQNINGYAHCGDPFPQNIISFCNRSGTKQVTNTLLHEFAHCREQLARKEKGLPPLEVGKTGEWLETVEGTVGLGHEARAEHFRKRMVPKI